MSDLSSSTLQSLFEAALHDYETQTGLRLIEHPLARQLESCNSVESITAVLQEQARALTEFRRDEDKVMKPLKRVVHVLHAFSTNLVRCVALVGYLCSQTLLL
jgi:fungal STAND N-terminal Goodbye domain